MAGAVSQEWETALLLRFACWESEMSQSIATIALVVCDYDEAISWFSRCLGFELISDLNMGGGKRWVVVRPAGGKGAALLLAKAVGDQARAIGDQSGGRVFLFLETDDFVSAHTRMKREGVKFHEEPRHEAYGTVAVFEDLCGNKWDLLEPKPA
jgi:catechol 2,3-dioxygenase-like lactoylglutathione lyase family enzyme